MSGIYWSQQDFSFLIENSVWVTTGNTIEVSGDAYTNGRKEDMDELMVAADGSIMTVNRFGASANLPAVRSPFTEALRAATIPKPDQEIMDKWAGDPAIAKVYDALLAGNNVVNLVTLIERGLGVAPFRQQGRLLRRARDRSHILLRSGRWSLEVGGRIRPSERRYDTATIPRVPEGVVPEDFTRLDRDQALIAFEADWQAPEVRPSDPALLSPISGDLYRVVAVWDLTPMEAAAISSSITIRGY